MSLDVVPPLRKTASFQGKQALLHWCKVNTTGYKNVEVTNFTTSWKDGLAFCALVHHFAPEKINFDALDPSKPLENLELAFKVAAEIGVHRLLEPEDMMVGPYPEPQSVMTYLSQFYHHFSGTKSWGIGGIIYDPENPDAVAVETREPGLRPKIIDQTPTIRTPPVERSQPNLIKFVPPRPENPTTLSDVSHPMEVEPASDTQVRQEFVVFKQNEGTVEPAERKPSAGEEESISMEIDVDLDTEHEDSNIETKIVEERNSQTKNEALLEPQNSPPSPTIEIESPIITISEPDSTNKKRHQEKVERTQEPQQKRPKTFQTKQRAVSLRNNPFIQNDRKLQQEKVQSNTTEDLPSPRKRTPVTTIQTEVHPTTTTTVSGQDEQPLDERSTTLDPYNDPRMIRVRERRRSARNRPAPSLGTETEEEERREKERQARQLQREAKQREEQEKKLEEERLKSQKEEEEKEKLKHKQPKKSFLSKSTVVILAVGAAVVSAVMVGFYLYSKK